VTRTAEKSAQPMFIAGVFAPLATTETEIMHFMQVIRPRCARDGCEIHLAASEQFVAGITAAPEKRQDRVDSIRKFLGDECARSGFSIELGESNAERTSATRASEKPAVASMTIRLAGTLSEVRSHLHALEPHGRWEGGDVAPRYHTFRGAVVTYHPTTESLQFQGNPNAAIALRDGFRARIGRLIGLDSPANPDPSE
jgi:hypothetical protein